MAQLYVVVVLAGALSVLFEVAYGAYLPGLVSPSGFKRGGRPLHADERLIDLRSVSASEFPARRR